MFGLGFTEILLIAVVALLFIGPDKLPDTMKQIARTFGKVKRALDDTKATISQELNVDELRQEALSYKQELESAKSELTAFKNIANEDMQQINKSTKIEDSYRPTDINDDKLFDDLFEEAESDFKSLNDKSKKVEEVVKNSNSEEKESESKSDIASSESDTVGFKHLKGDK